MDSFQAALERSSQCHRKRLIGYICATKVTATWVDTWRPSTSLARLVLNAETLERVVNDWMEAKWVA
jgi:hypothetical protein